MALHTEIGLRADQFHYLSICAGYGGLDLGLHIAEPGARAVGYIERDAHAAATLVARMEDASLGDAPIWDDLTTFDGRHWRGCVDLVIAGYPCQPFSCSGKRRGAADSRHLWPHVARVIREVHPEWVFLENVKDHVTLGLAEVGQNLRRLGYRPKAGLFSAAETSAPHWRERLFVLAHTNGTDGRQYAAAEDRKGRNSAGTGAGRRFTGRLERRSNHLVGHDLDSAGTRVLAAGEKATTGLPLYPPAPGDLQDWRRTLSNQPELEPSVLRMADGLADRLDRCRGTGNGVVPLAAALAYRTLKADFAS